VINIPPRLVGVPNAVLHSPPGSACKRTGGEKFVFFKNSYTQKCCSLASLWALYRLPIGKGAAMGRADYARNKNARAKLLRDVDL